MGEERSADITPFEPSGYYQTHEKPPTNTSRHSELPRACLAPNLLGQILLLPTGSAAIAPFRQISHDSLLRMPLNRGQETPAKGLIHLSPQTMAPSLFVLRDLSCGSSFPQYRGSFQRHAQAESTTRVGSGSDAQFKFVLLTSIPSLLQRKQKRKPGL